MLFTRYRSPPTGEKQEMHPETLSILEFWAGPLIEHVQAQVGADGLLLYSAVDGDGAEPALARGLPGASAAAGDLVRVQVRDGNGDACGALVAVSLKPGAFGEDEVRLLAAFAPAFAALMKLSDELARARRKLAGRRAVEQAKGVLQARDGCTEREAYGHLRKLSRTTRQPMHEVARRLIAPR